MQTEASNIKKFGLIQNSCSQVIFMILKYEKNWNGIKNQLFYIKYQKDWLYDYKRDSIIYYRKWDAGGKSVST